MINEENITRLWDESQVSGLRKQWSDISPEGRKVRLAFARAVERATYLSQAGPEIFHFDGEQSLRQPGLSFMTLGQANRWRNEESFGNSCRDWGPVDWSNAVAGEAGEACNVVKKFRRGDFGLIQMKERVSEEIGGVVIYADLFAQHLGLNLQDLVVKTFNDVSNKRMSRFYLR